MPNIDIIPPHRPYPYGPRPTVGAKGEVTTPGREYVFKYITSTPKGSAGLKGHSGGSDTLMIDGRVVQRNEYGTTKGDRK
ncbi:hypothetical protein GpSGHVEth038 [Glossina pallidipes salivary gland hypertrophy virus]|uniref:Uncharacterized protein n=1 Tax=Glossina hytrovirus (isolate Glossina pallidipes/Ethiopia/Seibersdorf/-) TaxID=379529 RepID=A0A110AQ77_GHVS|nr:hypothetical protein GpSGHVEth038 [Glossina pallidipes salivary gland hypertrophy virus]